MLRRWQQQREEEHRTYRNLANVTQSPSQYHPHYPGFLPTNRSFTLTIPEDNFNENGSSVDATSRSTSESSLVSPTQ